MKTTLVIDANGQKPFTLKQSLALIATLDLKKIYVCGASAQARLWYSSITKNIQKTDIKVYQANKLEGESTIISTSFAIQAASDAILDGSKVIIISRSAGFKKLAEDLSNSLRVDVLWVPAINNDTIKMIFNPSAETLTENIRTAANQIIFNHNNGKPMLIPALANELMALIPDLKNPEMRLEMFGKPEFKAVLTCCGIRTSGNTAYPSLTN